MRHGKERMVLFMDSLIKLLKGNARLSNEQLAVMLGVTPEEVAARIADYEKRGVIKGYSFYRS